MAEDNQDAKKKASAPQGTKKAAPKKTLTGDKPKKPAAAKKARPEAGVKAAPKAGAKKAAPEPARTKAVPAKKAPVKKAPPAKQKPAGRTVTVTQTGSPIGRKACQRATLVGLGLNKMHKTRTLQDTPEVRGMINKVKHLVKVEDAA